jgi:hypothetical protein
MERLARRKRSRQYGLLPADEGSICLGPVFVRFAFHRPTVLPQMTVDGVLNLRLASSIPASSVADFGMAGSKRDHLDRMHSRSRRHQHASVSCMSEPPFRSASEWGNAAEIPWPLI